jgi:peptidyl-prolyl cis-trans isomerase B (cyclophilin B)
MALRNLRTAFLVAAVMGAGAMIAEAAVIAPVKQYAKPNEPVNVKFLNENEQGKKALEKIGIAATELEGMFTAAPMGEVMAADGTPAFAVYSFDGKKLEAVKAKIEGPEAEVDIAACYPQVKEAGTYVLVWKDATPLVIETLRNPLPWAGLMDESRISAAQREDVRRRAMTEKPVVTHLAPLEYAVITTDKGVIKAKFAYDMAPHTAANFITLAREKLYDGSAFHRIMTGFMIQGGDSLANVEGRAGTGGPGYSLAAELNDKLHERGVLSMARSNSVDSAGSQFFIMHAKSAQLDGRYTAFGDVIEGMNVVDEIAKTPVSDNNGTVSGAKPKIESVRILPATAEMYGIKKGPESSSR